MRRVSVFSAVLALLVFRLPQLRAQAAPADLVQQVQAADLLADLITYTVDRGDARMQDAQQFLASIGKTQDFEKAHPNAQAPRPLNYMLLFRGSLAFVEGDGQKYADPSVKDQPQAQLYQELTAAQYYNMHEFLHFNQQRQAFASMQAYLESINEYRHFLDSGGSKDAAMAKPPATGPTPATADAVASRMGDMLQFIHDTAMKEATAKGTSQADFEKQWPAQVKAYRQSVMTKIEGSQPSANAFGQSQLAGSTPPPPAMPAPPPLPTPTVIAQPTDAGANRALPTPVESPYTNSVYRARDTSLWNMWDDNLR